MAVLTGIDVLGVQRYIFSSNRIKDVVAGSYVVHWITSLDGVIAEMVGRGLMAEKDVLLAGGGNAYIEFPSIEKAKVFAAHYTRALHDRATGLEVVVVHEPFKEGDLALALQKIQITLAKAKTERIPSVPLSGLSVTASCMETGQPAIAVDRDDATLPISRNIVNRREKKDEANNYWKQFLGDCAGFDFPLELDQLGRSEGDTSQLGVVHIDGNGVGSLIKDWLDKKVQNGTGDEAVRVEYRELSESIDRLGKDALKAVVDRLSRSIDKGKKVYGEPERLCFGLKKNKKSGNWLLPIRPILLGGDDLTFVCDGRIALSLAEAALVVFEKREALPHIGQIKACAGIAIVHVHSPFARAYELAEKLCRSAKDKSRTTGNGACALDWHIGMARPAETLHEIRLRHYQGKKLTCRPYLLGSESDQNKETWFWFCRMLLDDPTYGLRGEVWSDKHNKVKTLAEVVRDGADVVKKTIKVWWASDSIHEDDAAFTWSFFKESGGFFDGSSTPLLDAIELVDLHLVLENAVHESTGDQGAEQC
ncbi:MAG: hypothetical protein HGA41_00385 [Syntrophaceae bacterium]|nr:hypothetical protein [Syntrophaceae bacterium]